MLEQVNLRMKDAIRVHDEASVWMGKKRLNEIWVSLIEMDTHG